MSIDVVLIVAGCFGLLELVTRARITRTLWRESLRLIALLELATMLLMRHIRPPRFALVGRCHRCGSCCRQLAADPPPFIKKTFLLAGYIFLHKLLHNFDVVGRGPDGEVVFACAHLRQDGRCSIYRHRPFLCRNYPLRPFFTIPQMLPGCGFAAAPRVVAAMQRRASLPIVNPGVTVHHPTRQHRGEDFPGDYEWLDDT